MWEQLANTAIGTGMGLLLEGHNDRRQVNQQRRLQALEIQGQKQMGDYNYGKQLQFWKDTNFSAQMEQMKMAGLNPALMYKQGGSGGMTIGAPGGNVEGGSAPQGGMEIMNAITQKAQIDLIKAQTEKTKAETQNVPLTGENIQASTGSLLQGIESSKTQQALTEVETAIKSIEEHIMGKTQNMAIATIQKNLQILNNDETISNETKNNKIKLIAAELSNKIADTLNKQKQTAKTAKEMEEIDKKIQLLQQEYNINKIDEEMAADNFNPKAGGVMKIIYNLIRLIAGIGR